MRPQTPHRILSHPRCTGLAGRLRAQALARTRALVTRAGFELKPSPLFTQPAPFGIAIPLFITNHSKRAHVVEMFSLFCEPLRDPQEDENVHEHAMLESVRGLSTGPFRQLRTPRDDSMPRHRSLEINTLRSQSDSNEPEVVTLKQLKGWRRVLIVQRPKKEDLGRKLGLSSRAPGDQAGGANLDHGRWGKVPARLRFSTPHWESKMAVQQAASSTPYQTQSARSVNPGVPTGFAALRSRSALCCDYVCCAIDAGRAHICSWLFVRYVW